jgi:hypothetical protein
VIIAVLTQHSPVLQSDRLCTGVTHSKRLVVLVGEKTALALQRDLLESATTKSEVTETSKTVKTRGHPSCPVLAIGLYCAALPTS